MTAQRATILVIDDDPGFVRWLSAVLGNAGFDVLSLLGVADGPLPAELAGADAVILDLALPGVDGFGILDRFRADPTVRDMPILMLTAHDPVAYRLKGLALGADDYLVKPPNKQELLLRLRALLRRAGVGAGEPAKLAVQAADRSRALIDLRDIVFVQAANNFCWVNLAERRYMLAEGLTAAAGRLPQLLRVHRSYLVNPAHVLGVRRPTRSTVTLAVDTAAGDLVPVGAQYRADVLQQLGL